jgi:hypothetical protein
MRDEREEIIEDRINIKTQTPLKIKKASRLGRKAFHWSNY